ncbi:MAG: DUF4118 domain-containing protein [Dehalococcoidales bacterium]|nr:DUF4118 domain-containing protein [Dehalococcoidales bacterium]
MRIKIGNRQFSINWRGYLQGLGLVVLATLLGRLLSQLFLPANIIMIYLLCVVITAIFWGLGPSILVSILSVLAFDLFFVPPFLALHVADTQYILTFAALLLVGITISYLTSRVRRQTETARRRETETATLYTLSRNLAATISLESTVHTIMNSVRKTFERNVVIFLPDVQHKGSLNTYTDGSNINIDENDMTRARWSLENQQKAGYGTEVFPDAKTLYLPLNTARGTVGVMALYISDTAPQIADEQSRLLKAYADLAAVAVERTQLAEEARNAQILEAKGKLQTTLLNSISHDLRTPLVSIIGGLSSLQEDGLDLDDLTRKSLIQVARGEAERLNRLITNLLNTTRMEAGAMRLCLQPSDIQDLIGAALEQLSGRLDTRSVKIDIPLELPFISVDFGLVVQALFNILDNAMRYSPTDSPIEIAARQVDQQVEIKVVDRGIGIPAEDLSKVFEKFYRVQRPHDESGTGLGLAICKGIVEAHSGHIMAENRPGGGTVITLTLPATPAAARTTDE